MLQCKRTVRLSLGAVAVLALLFSSMALGDQPLNVAGSPTYNPATASGLKDFGLYFAWTNAPGMGVNNAGTAVGYSREYISGSSVADRAVRWDASGAAAAVLGDLGTYPGYSIRTTAYDINDAGTAVGYSYKYVAGNPMGEHAVRWNSTGTAATELGNLGTDASGAVDNRAFAINDAGTIVGYCRKYVSESSKGYRAVRWDASGTAATELGALGANASGFTTAYAFAVNNGGTAVGTSDMVVANVWLGTRAVRWDASGTAATELGNMGLRNDGYSIGEAFAINDAGTAVGTMERYDAGTLKGYRAVRWDASGTVATELGNLGTSGGGSTSAGAYSLNHVGTAVGYSAKYDLGSDKGYRAVRWDATGTVATELGTLGTNASGSTVAVAFAINDAGTAVGYSNKYVLGNNVGERAVAWLPDASVIDLNDLGVVSVPAGGTWTLTRTMALSADGWIAGSGDFDPDGAGPQAAYRRGWVGQLGLGGKWLNTSGLGNTWGKGQNWSTGTPAIQRDAIFDKNATYSAAFDRDEICRNLTVSAGIVSLALGTHSLTVTGQLKLFDTAGTRLNLSSGTLTVGSLDFSGNPALLNWTGGTLNVSNIAALPPVNIPLAGVLRAAGVVNGSIANAGTLAPGNSPGTLSITGDYTQDASATLAMELGGTTMGSGYDHLAITGLATLSGTIQVELYNGYQPQMGATFDLLDWGSIDGTFAQVTLPGLQPGLSWDTSNLYTRGELSVVLVPEPGALCLLLAGAGVLLGRQRRARESRDGGNAEAHSPLQSSLSQGTGYSGADRS